MINRNTQIIVPVFEGQYRMSLEEALKYCSQKGKYYELADTIMYNIPLRDELRSVGMEALVQELKDIVPDNDSLAKNLDEFAERYADKPLGNLDIQLYATTDDFTILGHTFHGLKDLKDRKEMYAWKWYSDIKFYSQNVVSDSPHVGELYEDFPCFDSCDFANEDRSYQNYIIRDRAITEEDLQKVFEAPDDINLQKTVEYMPLDILPLVYYGGYGRYIKVATKRE